MNFGPEILRVFEPTGDDLRQRADSRAEVLARDDLLLNSRPFTDPWANHVHWARWSETDAERGIDEVLAFFRERSLPFVWSVGPSTRPADLGARLLTRGFVRQTDALLLAARLPIVGLRTNPHLRIVPVLDEEMALVATRLHHAQWDDARVRAFAADLIGRIAAGRIHAVVGYLGEQAVANARWRIHADLRVVHLVGAEPSPDHRRRGAYSTLVAYRVRSTDAST